MIELGALVGAMLAGFVADKFSRRGAIRTGVVFFIIGSAIQTGSISYDMLVVGRLIGGIGIGFLSNTCPVYISELSPPHIRGILLGWVDKQDRAGRAKKRLGLTHFFLLAE